MHPVIQQVTDRINARSRKRRDHYLTRLEAARLKGPQRQTLHCGNLAHGFAACNPDDKTDLRAMVKPNIAMVSAYNDLLSAHQPYATYPSQIKLAVREAGGVAQFAGGVPAMCDGVTQGQPGMELSLLSRDVIAMATAVSLSHNLFDGGLLLGICDKIVPGLLMAALTFGHLPFLFVPAGPMPSGIANKEKARIRQLHAEGQVDDAALLDVEAASYHSPGTCTFYGTANSNQLVMEIMGLQLPGSSFVNPNTPLRQAFTHAAAQRIVHMTDSGADYLPLGRLVDAATLVNGVVGLLASGGSTNHTMHLIAIARAAGLVLNWDDFSDLSHVTPLIARIYPNGQADINHFQQAGGMAYFIRTLLDAGLLHEEVATVAGFGLRHYTRQPVLNQGLQWVDGADHTLNEQVLTSAEKPFKAQGGLRVLTGNLGRAVMKTSSLDEHQEVVDAPAMVFASQQALEAAFKAGMLNKDCVVVVRFQGPKACGMPELHKLTPILGILQDRGYRVALVTDGRMSGASGKIPAAIHVTPEAVDGGAIARIQNGDRLRVDGREGRLQWLISDAEQSSRVPQAYDAAPYLEGMGRELFGNLRRHLSGAEAGACSLFVTEEDGYV